MQKTHKWSSYTYLQIAILLSRVLGGFIYATSGGPVLRDVSIANYNAGTSIFFLDFDLAPAPMIWQRVKIENVSIGETMIMVLEHEFNATDVTMRSISVTGTGGVLEASGNIVDRDIKCTALPINLCY